MPVSFVDFVNGDVMSASAVLAEFDTALEWVNAIPLVDVLGQLESRHIYKAESYGYPITGMRGPLQEVRDRTVKGEAFDLRSRRDRFDLFLSARTIDDDIVPIPGCMTTLFLPDDSVVDIMAYWSAYDIHDPASQPYPANAGAFILAYHRRETGQIFKLAHSRREIHAPDDGVAHREQQWTTLGFLDVGFDAGTYDIFLAYDGDGAHAAANQIIIGHRGMTVDVLREG